MDSLPAQVDDNESLLFNKGLEVSILAQFYVIAVRIANLFGGEAGPSPLVPDCGNGNEALEKVKREHGSAGPNYGSVKQTVTPAPRAQCSQNQGGFRTSKNNVTDR